MKLISEQNLDLNEKSLEATIDLRESQSAGRFKIFVSGELAAQGLDRRMLLRINGIPVGYQSFVVMDGHAGGGEWDGMGLYAGRNGWGLDASLSVEYTISAEKIGQKRVGHGMSTFALGNNSILGYHCNGFLVSDAKIQSVQAVITGGKFQGAIKVYGY